MAPFFQQEQGKSTNHVRPARFQGTWYPADPAELAGLIQTAWQSVPFGLDPALSSSLDPASASQKRWPGAGVLLLPHPGLFYGLATQVAGLKACHPLPAEAAGRPGAGSSPADPGHIIILAPSHYCRLEAGRLYAWPYASLDCPLGSLKHSLGRPAGPGASRRLVLDRSVTDPEHGIESLLPVLAWRFPRAVHTVLVCGPAASWQQVQTMAGTVRELAADLQAETPGACLVVASSDMSHWGPRFGDPLPRQPEPGLTATDQAVRQRDRQALALAGHRGKQLLDRREELAPTMCGLVPVLVACEAAGTGLRLISQASSLDQEQQGPGGSFVTYAAAGQAPEELHHG